VPRGKVNETVKALREENAHLRGLLEMKTPNTTQSWAEFASQPMRDQMAAQALVAEKLDTLRALRWLGFQVDTSVMSIPQQTKDLIQEIFNTPGCKKILAADMEDANANKAAVIARLVKTSRYGNDGDSVRATQQLAKMCDWNEGDKNVAKAGAAQVNLMQMFASSDTPKRVQSEVLDPDAIIDATDVFVHDIGEAALVVDEEPVRKALA